MQCTSFYRDPYEHAAWQLYLRECTLRTAREEVAFLEATGGVTDEDMREIRRRVLQPNTDPSVIEIKHEDMPFRPTPTVSLKSVLTDVVQSDAINQLCRRVRPMLEPLGIPTYKKHQAVHILAADAQRVRDLGAGLI